MPKSAQQIVDKYGRGVSAAGPDYAAGVQNPKNDWLTAYTKSVPKMVAGLQAAMADNRMQKRAQSKGGTQNWQSKASGKGARNYVAAAADAKNGYQAVADKIVSAGQAARSAAAAMPDTTIEQRIARSAAAQLAISKHWK